MRYFEKQAGFWKKLFGLEKTKGQLLAESIKGSLGADDIIKGTFGLPKPKSIYGSQGLNELQATSEAFTKNKTRYYR